jgi:hypothetical protein
MIDNSNMLMNVRFYHIKIENFVQMYNKAAKVWDLYGIVGKFSVLIEIFT